MLTGRIRACTASAAALAAALVVTGSAGAAGDGRKDGRKTAPQDDRSRVVLAGGVFAEPGGTTVPPAVTYDRRLVPAGATIAVAQLTDRRGMSVSLTVRGLPADHAYEAHVHTRPCGSRPEDSGPHYRNVRAPGTPSTGSRDDGPENDPENEILLELETDDHGGDEDRASRTWRFRAGEARSVVLHERSARHGSGRTGHAGAGVACLTVPFAPAAPAGR